MKNPFVAGSWVRGENFCGRETLIREILEGQRNCVWVAGTRRLGKTSLLKQLELLTTEGKFSKQFLPLFWDMQGSQDLDGLSESLLESVEDAEERFGDVGVDVAALESEDVFSMLRTLRRHARDADLTLLLLCDETEELINIQQSNPEALPKLRRIMQRGENMLTVLTATRRLSKLEQSAVPNTSPFLFGFVPPLYLTPFEDEQARKLIALGGFDDEVAHEIMQRCNNHPYLLQLICRRHFDTPDLGAVIEEVYADEMIAHFFSVDFQYLAPGEKEILLHILQNEGLRLADLQLHFSDRLIEHLYELTQLGFVKRNDSRYEIANYFFRRWLEREKNTLFTQSTLQRATPATRPVALGEKQVQLPGPGDVLGQHQILEKLGAGGMGIVFKGRDLKLDRTVALKILNPQLTQDAEFKDRFLQEARAASAMNHPNITTIYGIGEESGLVFISMEFVAGEGLRTWRGRNAKALPELLRVAHQIGTGLAHAHNRNVVHRDVKSDNVLVTAENVAKIMDFGLAKSMKTPDMHLTRAGTTLGTLSYMSPEQASGLETDHRTDVFSLGVVFYELFTGVMPFTGEYELSVLYAILNEEPRPVRELNPELPEALEAIISKAMQKDKSKRYERMEDLLKELAVVASGR